ncbi:MAG: tetratricopeptide repeat protein [Desulfobacteraceae bacterium]|nr:tetratricopeptide repeat protein [Desulfobacteraceae bacterium]
MVEEKSRKELLEEPDPFLEIIDRMLAFGKQYQQQIVMGVCGIIALALVITGAVYFNGRTEDKAAVMLGKAVSAYNALGKDAPAAGLEEAKKSFKDIKDKYGSTGAGKTALIYYADVCYALKNYDEAIDAYRKALDAFDDPGIKSLILNGLAYSYEGKGDYEKAAAHFEMIVSDKSAAMIDQALFNLGRIYGKMGKAKEEKETFARLVKEFPDSMYFSLASEKIAG